MHWREQYIPSGLFSAWGTMHFLKPGFIEHFGYTHSSTYFSAVFYSSSPGFRAEVKGLTLGRRLHTCPLRARSKAWAGVWAAVWHLRSSDRKLAQFGGWTSQERGWDGCSFNITLLSKPWHLTLHTLNPWQIICGFLKFSLLWVTEWRTNNYKLINHFYGYKCLPFWWSFWKKTG